MSHIHIHETGGITFVGKDSVNLVRAITLKNSINLHKKIGMIPTRGVTITKMFAMATQYTGKTYKRGAHQQAIDDLHIWIETMKAAIPISSGQGEQA